MVDASPLPGGVALPDDDDVPPEDAPLEGAPPDDELVLPLPEYVPAGRSPVLEPASGLLHAARHAATMPSPSFIPSPSLMVVEAGPGFRCIGSPLPAFLPARRVEHAGGWGMFGPVESARAACKYRLGRSARTTAVRDSPGAADDSLGSATRGR